MDFLLGFLVGGIVGCTLGVIIMAMMAVSGKRSREEEARRDETA